MAPDGKAGEDLRALADFRQVLLAIGKAAALIGAKGCDALARQIVVLQKSKDTHRRRAAPAGEAHKDRVVAGHITNL